MKNFLKIFWITSFAIILSSCELDLLPTTAIELESGFKTYTDAEKFANGMHARFRATQYGIFSYTNEVQGDMFNASVDYGNRNGSPHRLDGTFTTSDYNLRDVWRPSYNAIMNFNNFISNVGLITPDNATQEANLAKFKGMAHFYRASTYHDLVRRFAKDYEPSTAASDLGVPLILTYDITEKPARATVAAVYAQIEADIAEAKTLLASTAGVLRATTPTLDAVIALEARVKLYMHKYDEAVTAATTLTNSATYSLASSATTMDNEFIYDNGTESIMQMYASLSEAVNANSIYLGYTPSTNKYAPDFIPTQTCINMYEATDLRYASWFASLPASFSTGNANMILFNKYQGNPSLYTAPTRTYRHKVKIFRIAEMYLIKAEALLSKSSPDAAGALTVLQALQTARAATLSTSATMTEVKKEWAKETIGEGFRIDCLKRWKDGFTNRVAQNTTFISTGAGFNEITVTAATSKLTWAIPQTDMDVNTNLVQNEGW